ncbi:MAG TPA: peptidoglycan DD-metalloendopeptidase family protein [Thermoanaerobaculia bacterium]|nr:peptidoglycan DD-metalloendopeptidase family protein [Thermoanaerobaculia bacterium]
MQQPRVHLGPRLLRLLLPLGLLILAAGILLTTRRLEAYNRSPYPLPPISRFSLRGTLPTETSALLDRARIPLEFTLLRGETAAQVFAKLGLQGAEVRQATNALAEHVNLRALKAGNRYSAFFGPDSTLASLEFTVNGDGRIAMRRDGDRWQTTWQPFARSVQVRVLRGELQGSLDASIQQAGGPAGLAYRMADVLQWDLDFHRDLHRGDHFQVLFEEVKLNGEPYAIGNLLALAYDGADGRRHEAFRWGDGGVYYDGEGRPLRKMFLRSPLRYSRITSSFSMHRFHPVLNVVRPHYGVDYGAPVGTPVQVTANGVVTFAGRDGGGGNVVKVRHGEQYVTAYLHLSRFAPGIRPGAHVRQGDTIAYTGATGLATGPHLDYRVQFRNQWIDPLSLKGVRDEPIPDYKLASFHTWHAEIVTCLANGVVPKSLGPEPLPETRLAVGRSQPETPASTIAR